MSDILKAEQSLFINMPFFRLLFILFLSSILLYIFYNISLTNFLFKILDPLFKNNNFPHKYPIEAIILV